MYIDSTARARVKFHCGENSIARCPFFMDDAWRFFFSFLMDVPMRLSDVCCMWAGADGVMGGARFIMETDM